MKSNSTWFFIEQSNLDFDNFAKICWEYGEKIVKMSSHGIWGFMTFLIRYLLKSMKVMSWKIVRYILAFLIRPKTLFRSKCFEKTNPLCFAFLILKEQYFLTFSKSGPFIIPCHVSDLLLSWYYVKYIAKGT